MNPGFIKLFIPTHWVKVELDERRTKLEALRAHLAEGAAQAARGEFVGSYSLSRLITDADAGR